MTVGTTPKQADLWRGTAAVCEGRVGEQSIWAVLYHQGDRLFADELFADLFAQVGSAGGWMSVGSASRPWHEIVDLRRLLTPLAECACLTPGAGGRIGGGSTGGCGVRSGSSTAFRRSCSWHYRYDRRT